MACEECFRKYDTVTQNFNQSGTPAIPDNCNGYTVTNMGSDTVTVDDITLFPGTAGSVAGDSFTTGGNRNEILAKTQHKIQFATTVSPLVQITYKFYL